MKKNKVLGLLFLCLALCGCSTVDPDSADQTSSTELTLYLNEGYDFTLNQVVTVEEDSDIFLKLYDNVPTLFFREWATITNIPYEEVTSVNVFVTPKLSNIQANFLAFHLPNLTLLSKTQDGNYVKYQITDTDGVVGTELGFTYSEDEFAYTLEYMINREGVPAF